jgi:hypothetical protein
VINGTNVTLFWQAEGDVGRVEQLNANAAVVATYPIVPIQQQITVPVVGAGGTQIFFRLIVERNFQQTISNPVPITVICVASWFFGDQFAPPNAGCPSAGAITTTGAFQRFERGFMIHLGGSGFNRVIAAQDQNALFFSLNNAWDGSTIRTESVPPGLFLPQQMFNWAYFNTLAPLGQTWNASLGWAITDFAAGNRTIQYESGSSSTSAFYVDSADGAVYRFSGGDAGTWTRIR